MRCKYFCWLTLLFAFISIGVNAQTKVEGTVLDESSNPLIGVTVATEDHKTGVVTDLDGHFAITVPKANESLTFSFVGYATQKISVKGKKFLKVVLKEDSELLDEVMVVGYGTQKKISVTSSIAQVDNKELMTAPAGSLSNMLAGRLPGLVARQSSGQPGQDGSSLYVRGIGAGDGNSLVVVDGVIVDYFPSFAPDEVESVTILKDATAAAVYGVRAGAGVILVTTKRGAVQKPTVTVNSSVVLSQNTNFPKFLNGPDYAYWYNTAQRLDGVPEESLRFSTSDIDRIENPGPDEEVYGNTDWFDLLFKDVAPTYQNNVSISGGTERLKFFASVGSYNQNGIIDRTSYDKYSFRSNMDAKVTDNFDLSLGLSGYVSKDAEPGASAGKGSYASIFQQAMLSYPYLKPYHNGVPVGSLNLDGNGNNNPIAARDLSGKNLNEKTYFQGNVDMKWKMPVKGLTLGLSGSYVKHYAMRKKYFLPYELDCWNQSTHSWGIEKGRITSQASLNQWFTQTEEYTVRPTVEYSNRFGKHDISGLFLYEFTRTASSSMSAGRDDFPITDIMDLNYGLKVNDNLVKGGHSQDKRAGYVMRLNYSYDDKYLFEFTGRIDASTALPKDNRWGFFPGVSVGWRISQENFFKNAVPFVENLKLRASAGRLGSDRSISNTMTYFSTASLSKNPVVLFGNTPAKDLSISRPINPNLKWELTDTYNVGLETSMWNGLLGVELDVFYMKTTRSLQSQSGNFPPSLGSYYPAYINFGSHDNRGFELVLTHRNHIKDFYYNVRGNVSWARNKVLKTTEDPNVPNYMRSTGRPFGEYWGFIAEGLFQTEEEIKHSALYGPTLPGDIKLKDINGDGKITYDQDRVPIGRSSTPEMMFGLNMNAEWKGIDFSMFWQGAAICDVNLCGVYSGVGYDNTFYTKPFYCDGNTPYYLVENSWRPDNRNAEYPRLGITSRSNGGKMSSWWVKDGAYVRLKTIQLGYTLPSKWTSLAGIKKVRFYMSGGNLFTFSHLKHLDPEMPSVNQGYYPQQRTYEFGLNVSF